MKQRNLALAIGILATISFIGLILLLVFAFSSETRYEVNSGFPYYISQATTSTGPVGLVYAGAILGGIPLLTNIILGIVLLASRSERAFKAGGLVTATGVLAIIGFVISGLPTLIVAFITYAQLSKELKENAAYEISPQ